MWLSYLHSTVEMQPYTMSALGLGIRGHWDISPSVQELLLAEVR